MDVSIARGNGRSDMRTTPGWKIEGKEGCRKAVEWGDKGRDLSTYNRVCPPFLKEAMKSPGELVKE